MNQIQWRRSSFCANGACLEVGAEWTRASACANGSCVEVKCSSYDNCIECQNDGAHVFVRDSKLGDRSPVLSFDPTSWRSFIGAVRAGAFTG